MKLINFSIKRRVTVSMFTVAILLFGVVSLTRLNVNLLPDLSYPTLTIRTELAGAAPIEIENLITKPIEEAVGIVKGVKKIRSISRTGQSDVVLEFVWGTDMDVINLDVIAKLDALQLPLESKKPVTLRFDPTLDPVMRYALYFDNEQSETLNKDEIKIEYVTEKDPQTERNDISDLKQLRIIADELLKKNLESSNGVAAVKISGGLEEEIQVNLDQRRMAYLKVPIEVITNILRAENINLSGGRLEEGTQQFLVRTLNEFQNIEQIRNVIVANSNGNSIYLKDIADISQAYKEREAITRLNGMEAVEVAIYKEGDGNTVAVAHAVEDRIRGIKETLPEGMKLEKIYDQSVFISSAVNEVRNAGIIGGIIVTVFSGSKFGVSGPAAGLITIVVAGISTFNGNLEVFFLAVFLSGIIQFLLGLFRLGVIGYFVPTSVINGMLASIGLL